MKLLSLIFLLPFLGFTLAYEQFCRCQCDSNYKIIPLKDQGCNTCTKNYCLSLDLKECEGFTEDKVLTTCFRECCNIFKSFILWMVILTSILIPERESTKDQFIVYTFILIAFGLLAYAIVGKPLLLKYRVSWTHCYPSIAWID